MHVEQDDRRPMLLGKFKSEVPPSADKSRSSGRCSMSRSTKRTVAASCSMYSTVGFSGGGTVSSCSGQLAGSIVLHQILQWHHMVTSAGYPPDSVSNLTINTLFDGLFHAVTWIAIAIGLLLLHRAVRQGYAWSGYRLRGGSPPSRPPPCQGDRREPSALGHWLPRPRRRAHHRWGVTL
jgi:hypothetical protein